MKSTHREGLGVRGSGLGARGPERRPRPGRGVTSLRQGFGGPPELQRRRKSPRGLCGASQLVVGLICIAALAGCRQDMHDQPKYRPLRASAFFENTSSARPLVEGTIARGTLQTDTAFFTGKNGAMLVSELPFPVTQAVLDRGQERFNIYCTPCHDATGSGNGLVVQRGYPKPQTYHSDRLRQIEAGYFFDVMTNGFGRMPDYRAQITPRDRWNIVAYIRALQLSQHAATSDVPGGDPTKLAKPAATGHEPAKH
jgi:mono/diheme cytochrome c family protein